jgi:heme/copper-type cytochrome/quinol oxidase subunit 4
MASSEISPEQRRRNARTAWLLAGFALFIFLTSIPFWKGLYRLVMHGGGS